MDSLIQVLDGLNDCGCGKKQPSAMAGYHLGAVTNALQLPTAAATADPSSSDIVLLGTTVSLPVALVGLALAVWGAAKLYKRRGPASLAGLGEHSRRHRRRSRRRR
jgi:hypothetical protein